MAIEIEATGPRSLAANTNQSFHLLGREKTRKPLPFVSKEEEAKLREELEGRFGLGFSLPRIHVPSLLVVDLHQSDMSGADALVPGPEQWVTSLGKRHKTLARVAIMSYMIWQLRRAS